YEELEELYNTALIHDERLKQFVCLAR
ncbi:hypothetical protein HKBW3S03_01770, partial [Candidatus Hakubella thermalkaliphila]